MKAINKIMRQVFIVTACATVCLVFTACANKPLLETTTPVLDKHFGESLKASKDAQKIAIDPSEVNTTHGSKELELSFDNYVKGKAPASPALKPPVSSTGAN